MGAFVLPQVPYSHIPSSITAYELSLIRMDHHIVDGASVRVIALHSRSPRIPDLYSAIFRAGDHPLTLAVESDASNITRVPLKGEKWCGVRGADIVQLDIVVTGRSQEALIGRNTEAVDLGVGVLNCA